MWLRHKAAMLTLSVVFSGFVGFVGLSGSAAAAAAALPPEVRKELSDLQKELKGVSQLVRQKKVDQARQLISRAESRLAELMIPDDEKDRAVAALRSQLIKARSSIPVGFEAEVAPILKQNCVRCHGAEQASGNLRLHTYAAMSQGGRSGLLARPGFPRQSLIVARLAAATDAERMPRGGEKLSDKDLMTIARWIEQGAVFDGENSESPIGDSLVPKKPPVKVVPADGSETVSFRKDIAPWVVNICTGCHSGENARGGYRMETFEQFLSGGDTAATIVSGDPDGSYIVDLVLRQKPLRMPAGQAQLKRSQAVALETWIREGARFDGTDAAAPMRSLVPTPAQIEAARLAAMTEEEFNARRLLQAAEFWKRIAPRSTTHTVTTEHLVVFGDPDEARLREFSTRGEAHVLALTEKYKLETAEKPWRGRLIVFVTKERFEYEEFNTVLMDGRRTPRSISGHSVVTENLDTAYIVMHDVGDTAPSNSLSSADLLKSLLGQAWISRRGKPLPDWLIQGFGTMEIGLSSSSDYLKDGSGRAATACRTLTNPADVFADGSFAPEDVGRIGYLVVRFLMASGGQRKLQQLVDELQRTADVNESLQNVYGASAETLGRAFIASGGR